MHWPHSHPPPLCTSVAIRRPWPAMLSASPRKAITCLLFSQWICSRRRIISSVWRYSQRKTQMASADDLLTRADQKLENNQFTGARDDYRIASLLAPLSETSLYNLRVAEEVEGLSFRQSLRVA